MKHTDDGAIFTPRFVSLLLGIVFGTPFLVGSTLLVVAWVKAATYDGVGDTGVHDLLLWGFALTAIGLTALVPVALWHVAAWRSRATAAG